MFCKDYNFLNLNGGHRNIMFWYSWVYDIVATVILGYQTMTSAILEAPAAKTALEALLPGSERPRWGSVRDDSREDPRHPPDKRKRDRKRERERERERESEHSNEEYTANSCW